MLSSLDSLVPLEKTLSRGEAELRPGIDQIGIRLDARDFSGKGVALRLQQIELRDGPDLVAVVGLLRRMRRGNPAGPRGSAAGDGRCHGLPLPVDGVARGEPHPQLAGTGDVGARVLAADAGDAGEIERPGEIDRRLPGPVVAGEARSGGPALASFESELNRLPAVVAATGSTRAAEQDAGAQRFALLPSVAGTFSERGTTAPGFSGHDWTWQAAINFAWSFDLTSIASIRSQDAGADVARARELRVRLAARDAIHRQWETVAASIARSRSARAGRVAAAHAAQQAHDRYQVGT